MGLSNKQRLMIMRKAKEMNYKGSLLDLFKEAEAGGFANDINKPAPAPYISKKSDFGIPTTYEKGGIKKLKGEPIDNKSAIPGETISLRHGLDNMPNSFKDFLQKQHVLSSSDLEKKPEQMQNGGMGDGSQDAPTGSWEPANEGLYFKNMLMEHISKDRNADNVLRVMNDVAMFESNNDITAIQAPRKEGGKPGPARGKYQYEVEEDGSNSANTAVNRLVNFLVDIKGQSLKNIENNFPELHSQYVKKSADFTEFNSDFQDAFFLADNIYGGKDRAEIFNSVAKKKDLESIDVFRFWLKNHKAKLNGKTVDKLSKEEIDAKFLEWTNRVPEPEAVDKKEDGGVNDNDEDWEKTKEESRIADARQSTLLDTFRPPSSADNEIRDAVSAYKRKKVQYRIKELNPDRGKTPKPYNDQDLAIQNIRQSLGNIDDELFNEILEEGKNIKGSLKGVGTGIDGLKAMYNLDLSTAKELLKEANIDKNIILDGTNMPYAVKKYLQSKLKKGGYKSIKKYR